MLHPPSIEAVAVAAGGNSGKPRPSFESPASPLSEYQFGITEGGPKGFPTSLEPPFVSNRRRCCSGHPLRPPLQTNGSARPPLPRCGLSFPRDSTKPDENGFEPLDSSSPDSLRPPLDRLDFEVCHSSPLKLLTDRWDSSDGASFAGNRKGRIWQGEMRLVAREGDGVVWWEELGSRVGWSWVVSKRGARWGCVVAIGFGEWGSDGGGCSDGYLMEE
ncbi:hypothetical protein GQ457_12G012370 [Hibiscus cannabinus]